MSPGDAVVFAHGKKRGRVAHAVDAVREQHNGSSCGLVVLACGERYQQTDVEPAGTGRRMCQRCAEALERRAQS